MIVVCGCWCRDGRQPLIKRFYQSQEGEEIVNHKTGVMFNHKTGMMFFFVVFCTVLLSPLWY